MNKFWIIFFSVMVVSGADYKRLRCLVCRAVINEMNKEIEKVNPNKKIQAGGYRLDDSGNLEQKLVPYSRSAMHLSELMDTICSKMEDYVRATDKTSKKLMLPKLLTDSGELNPVLSEMDIIQDSDLNKSLAFYCEGILEEFEDEIYDELKEVSSSAVSDICEKRTRLCDSSEKDEL